MPPNAMFWYGGVYVRPYGVNIFSFNLAQPGSGERGVATLCAEQADILYMSQKNLYLVQGKIIGEDYSKIRKIYVYRGKIVPFADAIVRGTTKSQFSLDENDQLLRIITTNKNNIQGRVSSNIFVLDYWLRPYG